MTYLKKMVGEKIREIRKHKGLTQEELSERAQIKYTYLGDVERGVRNISLESLEKIMNALEIRPGDLFDYRELNLSSNEIELEAILEVHHNYLKVKKIEDVKMIHVITKEIFKRMEERG
ncbi:helix-turn-helix domain-containing protein [Paenibacillus sp. WC2504]|uniref:helix-turn-helix domain-containing protein n=1 Tax=Paenibacillus sp. WC2504 TaxID=3461403 RepID=UPI0040465BDD